MNPPPDRILEISDLSAEDAKQLLESMERAMARDAANWFANFAIIPTKDGNEGPVEKVNKLQERVLDHYRRCQLLGVPCLIMILKPRQKGASTIAEAVIYNHLRRYKLKGLIMGDVDATSGKVFNMFRRYAETDTFPWGDGLPPLDAALNQSENITLPNGSTFATETAGSKNAGRSGTVQVLHLDEVAFFNQDKGKDPTTAVLGSFAKEFPRSLGFATSTANGCSGWFYNTWNNAESGWHKIFAAWFEFDDSTRKFHSAEERERFAKSLTDDEKQEQKLHPEVTLENLHWRRHIINTDYEGDVGRFRQEMPSDPESCFLLSSSPRFDLGAIKEAKAAAATNDKRRKYVLRIQMGARMSVTPLPDPEGDVWIQEEPIVGCKYIGALDTMTGADQDTGAVAKRDWHVAHIWRCGYMTRGGDYVPPALVAMHRSQVETEVLAEIFAGMSIYYGRCMTVPEINGQAGIFIVKELLKYKIPMFRRIALSAATKRKMSDVDILGAYGFCTDPRTKKLMIETLVPMVRKQELDIRFPEVWDEFRNFIVNEKGGCEAMSGKHDDHVMTAGIAVLNFSGATEYRERPGFLGEANDGWRVA